MRSHEGSAGIVVLRRRYGVPARRGGRVVVEGRPGVIVGADRAGLLLRVRFEGETELVSVHPVFEVVYDDRIQGPVLSVVGTVRWVVARLREAFPDTQWRIGRVSTAGYRTRVVVSWSGPPTLDEATAVAAPWSTGRLDLDSGRYVDLVTVTLPDGQSATLAPDVRLDLHPS